MSNIENAKYLLTDLIQGDESVASRADFQGISGKDIQDAIVSIVSNPQLSDKEKRYLLFNSWRVHYKQKPPTISEFLTPEWIGPTGLSVYDHVRTTLEEFWHPFSPYRHMLLASSIGWGKSYASAISTLYINTHLCLLRDPKRFFGLSQASSIVSALISFSLDKAKQLLLQPFMQILLTSPKFRRVKTEESVPIRQKEYPDDIVWTTAGKVGAIQFHNDLHIMVASNPAHILGLSLINAILSELSFFLDRGISPETIWRVMNDAKGRIYSRFGDRYFATSIVDSSPNDMSQSPIDKYIFSGEAAKDPLNYVVTGAHWEVHPTKYPKWQETGETFPVFRGSGSQPPKILENEEDIDKFTATEIYHVPIDVKQKFKDDLKKSVKDYCGWPAGSDAKLFTNHGVIEEMFYPQLINTYSYIYAPASQSPERLIWDQIVDMFFIKINKNTYEFYRSSREKRFIHVDQSESGDLTGIAMCHPETDNEGKIVIVVDFSIVIAPPIEDKINLDAIPEFIMDLNKIGHVSVDLSTFDQFQSSSAQQRLKREGFNVEKLSVDREMGPYNVLASWIKNNRIKMGRNIFVKNNLKSLQIVKTDKANKQKIDHMLGDTVLDDGGNWELSLMGINAKDASDAVCGAVYNCINRYDGIPRYQWSEYSNNESLEEMEEEIKDKIYSKTGLMLPRRV